MTLLYTVNQNNKRREELAPNLGRQGNESDLKQ